MGKKAQVLIIILWILAILTILAVVVGHRVSMALRLSRYQRDRLKAFCLAKAGVNRAIVELAIDKNTNDYDSLNETWSTGSDPQTNRPLFENVEIRQGSGETFTVKYLYDKEKNTYLCMVDEERKINIDGIDTDLNKEILVKLFEFAEVQNPEELKDLVAKWINTTVDSEDTEGIFKNGNLKTPEELLIILEYFYQNKGDSEPEKKSQEIYSRIKDLITVWGEGKVNINTADQKILEILITACIKKLQQDGHTINVQPEILLEKILKYREGAIFANTNLETLLDLSGPDQSQLTDIINELKNLIITQSNHFRIISEGNIYGLRRKISCIYNRGKRRIVFWHEN